MNNLKLIKNITEPLTIDGQVFDEQSLVVIAGPCAVEELNGLTQTATILMEHGIRFMRAGAYKPRTSPYSFQGLGTKGLEILGEVKAKTGIRLVTEITSVAELPDFLPLIDIIQIGARNMQNFELLKALGRTDRPILLKRGFGNTIEEWLGAAEYILLEGNQKIILCERGIRSFETETRNTLDISSVPIIHNITKLPIIVDPSHASGRSDLIAPLAMASVAAGANGLLIEVHIDPKRALSDREQALSMDEFLPLYQKLQQLKICINDLNK